MYNEELKTEFIKNYTQSINTAKVAAGLFAMTAPYEEKWNADLCTRSAGELQPVINDIMALRYRSQWMAMTILREYVKWCIFMKVPDACDGMLHIITVGLEKIRKQMVSSPLHLQRYMDSIFDREQEETVDNLYRCYYWMAFGGIKEEDTVLVKASDVNFPDMCIRYKDTNIPIYREALPAFHNAAELTEFLYKHPKYTNPIKRSRIPGDTLMRGIKSYTRTKTVRSALSAHAAAAAEEGKTDLRLSFQRVWTSGLFYRMYERERAGIPVNFTDAAAAFTAGKTYHLSGRIKIKHKQNQKERDYMEDYQRWKLAFSI